MACAGGLRIPSVEETELLYPIHFEHLEVEPDSAGLGEHIGGPGVRCRIRARDADLTVFDINDGLDNPPFGHGGATAAAGGGHFIERTDGERRVLPPTSLEVLRPGDTWTAVGTGGGGWGNPLNRPIERVREDVRDGYISRGRAREVYGLVVDASLDPVVDTSATEAARAVIRGRQRNSDGSNTIVPSTPRASDWLKANLRPTDVRVAPMTRKDLR
jgi:N-methylhydantoinase B